jgi:flavin-dependent dehydrogenase
VTSDVLIVGAGPAGSMAAIALARQGLTVRVIDDGADRGESHDLLVNAPTLAALDSLGGLTGLPVRHVDEMEIRFGHARPRVLAGLANGVCDRDQLRDSLHRLMAAAGVEHIRARAEGFPMDARHVVMAAGAGDRPATSAYAAGRTYAGRFAGEAARVLLQSVTPDAADPRQMPSFLRVLPGNDGVVTVSLTTLGDRDLDLTRLTAAFGDALEPAGPVVSGPVDTGFSPDMAVSPDELRIGDAAGLVNPFTGDGLGYAIESALLAVQSIMDNKADPAAARLAYRHRLGSAFVGYFESARHAARRYHLAWRILESAAEDDGPFFVKGYRAILLPEGINGLATERMSPDWSLAPFLAACDEVAVSAVRHEWPFLARLLAEEGAGVGQQLRPALLFASALTSSGGPPEVDHAPVGAAIELATFGTLAFLSPGGRHRPSVRGIDWTLATTVLAGDFLLSQASRLIAGAAPGLSWAFAEWLADLTAMRATRASATELFGALFEFPARIGAQLANADPPVAREVRDIGYHCGEMFLLGEDVLALQGKRTRLDLTSAGMADRGISSTLDLGKAELSCRDIHRLTREAIAGIPHPRSARLLRRFADAVAAPVIQGKEPRP